MKGLIISKGVEKHIAEKHAVSPREVEQCFENCDGEHLYDQREKHASDPRTQWFIAETNTGRKLKVAFVFDDGKVYLRTAYEPNAEEIRIYEKFAYV
ncbi:ADP-ribosyl-(dinitrogen reductase) hydrolase [Pseudomonas aeruginosa]|uniref:ADP-ribosyl-(dinitrogen reductase) hydrolase n=1 Tax=Pseudomonas aeruginosa TaxID=287 RepID=UPI0009363A48|nr:ADP-ribosyl-(dinitrogen reductase) hydrolase [Pseudomonas aeruginosa]KAA5578040.1 ADP-ribosyl-(dinitrogen reductase) hydrolase [Pseudomonas aeruginosa]MBI7116767.1 ADP-ribosyl-(dinitrogen reductase) hydrolase [Pseudomonas aeruginosa]MBV6107000.1 ADP-ribosyl-(dinitrogen reductase) hydrolase [Pseudomonas aeruginosa]MBX5584951.1 ADP-ribosyl-(dinitrogen reductase) hydrolase [Pseudomonas aeruginosa]MBX5625961.1 ADP-ribosyl-(dinitrogen reductase) hydrolase [Pseudomonas aeruginosa]